MINDNIETVEVWSAGKSHLLMGLIAVFGIIAFETLAVREFFISSFSEAIGIALVMQCAVGILILLSTTLGMYKRREKFHIHYCDIEGANMKWIKSNYHICKIDEDGVIFVDKKDRNLYDSWSILNTIVNTSLAIDDLKKVGSVI